MIRRNVVSVTRPSVNKLRQYNEDHRNLLTEPPKLAFARALLTYVLANTNTILDLELIQAVTGPEDDLIRQAARLKLLQSTTASSRGAVSIESQLLQPTQSIPAVQSSRPLCMYDSIARKWIEWLDIERTLTPRELSQTRERIKTLSVMLYSAPESFRIAKCISYLNGLSNPYHAGLVLRVPQNLGMAVPITRMLSMASPRRSICTP